MTPSPENPFLRFLHSLHVALNLRLSPEIASTDLSALPLHLSPEIVELNYLFQKYLKTVESFQHALGPQTLRTWEEQKLLLKHLGFSSPYILKTLDLTDHIYACNPRPFVRM